MIEYMISFKSIQVEKRRNYRNNFHDFQRKGLEGIIYPNPSEIPVPLRGTRIGAIHLGIPSELSRTYLCGFGVWCGVQRSFHFSFASTSAANILEKTVP